MVYEASVDFEPRSMGLTVKGMRVHTIEGGGQADLAGVEVGWTIAYVNDVPTPDQGALKEEVTLVVF